MMIVSSVFSDDFHYIFYAAVERSVVLQFDGAHSCSKLSGFYRIGALQALVEIAGRIGVAASGSIHHLMRSIGWNLVERIVYITSEPSLPRVMITSVTPQE